MKRNIIIWIIVGVILVALMVLAANISTLKENNKTLEITKKINAGIPYEWKYEIEDSSIVECIDVYILKDENNNGKVGAPIYRNYVFKGLKEGTTKVIFKLSSITNEDEEEQEEVYIIKVDKDLKVSLVEE